MSGLPIDAPLTWQYEPSAASNKSSIFKLGINIKTGISYPSIFFFNTSIRGALGLLKTGVVGEIPEKAQNLLKIADNNTQRLLLLINDILNLQKIKSGTLSFDFQNIELTPCRFTPNRSSGENRSPGLRT